MAERLGEGMKLYHFTSWHHYRAIRRDGRIEMTESNIGSDNPDWPPCGDHVGPDVVWLTSRELPAENGVEVPQVELEALSAATGTAAIELDKTQVRLTVEVPRQEVHRWSAWAKEKGAHPKWRRSFRTEASPRFWYVIERAVLADEITEAVALKLLSRHLTADEAEDEAIEETVDGEGEVPGS